MERETPPQDYAPVEAAVKKFTALRARFTAEVSPTDLKGRAIAEAILTEVQNTAVEALIKSKGHPHVMAALEQEFARPLLGDEPSEDHQLTGVMRIMIGDVATKVTQRLTREQ